VHRYFLRCKRNKIFVLVTLLFVDYRVIARLGRFYRIMQEYTIVQDSSVASRFS